MLLSVLIMFFMTLLSDFFLQWEEPITFGQFVESFDEYVMASPSLPVILVHVFTVPP